MNFDDIDIDSLTENEIIKLYSDIIDAGDTEDKLHIMASCSIVNGWAYCKSDRRLKDNISDNKNGLEKINKLQVKNYIYKNDETRTPHVGVIAQELKNVFPNAVSQNDEGYLLVRTEDIFYAMVNAIKELSRQNEDLKSRLDDIDKSAKISKHNFN